MNSEFPAPDEAASPFPDSNSTAPTESFVDEAPDLNAQAFVDEGVEESAIDTSFVDEDDENGSFDFEAFRANLPRVPAPRLQPEPDADAKPERVSKLMSRAGIASRHAAEEMIGEGRVSVNGHFVREPGVKADPTRDRIVVDNRPLSVGEKTTTVVVLHKPKYVMTTRDDPGGRTTVFDLLPKQFVNFYAVGRLDFETTGVLLLTDDGALAHLLTHPSHGVEKVYEARVRGEVSVEAIARLREGLWLEDGKTAPCRARVAAQREKNALVELTLREGRNRQVRRMLEAVGHPVSALRRVKFAGVQLEGLLPGAHRQLLPGEVKALRRHTESGLKDAKRAKRAALDPTFKPKAKPARKPLFGPSKTKVAAQNARANASNKPVRGEKPVGPYEVARQNAKRFADAEEKRLAKPGAVPFRGVPRVDEARVPRVDEARVPKVRPSRARVEDTSNPLRANDRSGGARPSDSRGASSRGASSRGASSRGASSRGAGLRSGESRPNFSRESDARGEESRPQRPNFTRENSSRGADSRSDENRSNARDTNARGAASRPNISREERARPRDARGNEARPVRASDTDSRPNSSRPTDARSPRGFDSRSGAPRAERNSERPVDQRTTRASMPSGFKPSASGNSNRDARNREARGGEARGEAAAARRPREADSRTSSGRESASRGANRSVKPRDERAQPAPQTPLARRIQRKWD